MQRGDKIYVAGHRGMVGSALVRELKRHGHENLLLASSSELDLTRQAAVDDFFARERPLHVFMAAARVGGIEANRTYRAEFIRTNLQIQTNIMDAAWKSGVQRFLFFGSSCIYPRLCPQPMKEEHLWSGPLEPTNSPYAAAKLAGVEMCRAYRDQYGARFFSVIPTNLYGPNDNYDPQQSHVMAALISKFHKAKESGVPSVTLWGTGTPRRELMHVDDLAEAALFLMGNYDGAEPVNIGTGEDTTIRELAELVGSVVGYAGKLEFDATKPDGVPRKLLDVGFLSSLGWKARIPLREGIAGAYADYLKRV